VRQALLVLSREAAVVSAAPVNPGFFPVACMTAAYRRSLPSLSVSKPETESIPVRLAYLQLKDSTQRTGIQATTPENADKSAVLRDHELIDS